MSQTTVTLLKNIPGVPAGTKGVVERTQYGITSVRWVWPAGTFLPNALDRDEFSQREMETLFSKP